MNRQFKHNSGALVVIDEHGKKTLYKYGKEFSSFLQIKKYELEMKKKGVDLNTKANQDILNIYREYRQK